MGSFKKLLHQMYVAIGKVVAKLLPDRVPVTFVGADAVRELCGSIADHGVGKVLIVTDAILVDLGIVARVTGALDAAGVTWSIYSDVTPDPTTDQVETGLARLQADRCDGVLAVGGGSPMDAAKMIAALATNGRPLAKLEGMLRIRKLPLPLFAIPTTAGTGSEATVAAVVSDPVTHAKKFYLDPKLMPSMAALDPGLMTGLPPAVTAATGMDALTHAVESFIAKSSTPQTEAYAKIAVRLVFENLPKAYEHGDDLAARKAMALASFYAGIAFTRTSVGYVHAIAHNFGALYRTPHGLANAIALPHVLEFSKREAQPRLAQLAAVIGITAGSEADRAAAFIAAVRDLMARVGIPATLAALRSEDIATIAERACAEAYLNYPVPRFMERHECESLLRRILPPPVAAT
jgi:alcohol dehydrogenase